MNLSDGLMPFAAWSCITSFRFVSQNRRGLQKVGQIACVDNKVIRLRLVLVQVL